MATLFVKIATELFTFNFKRHYERKNHDAFFLQKKKRSARITQGEILMDFLDREAKLLSKNQLEKIKNANVCVFGCGGVGGYVIEMLSRCGVGHLTVVDFDRVDITNINRQIIATHETVGGLKVELFEKRCKEINPEIKITAINSKFCEQTKDEFEWKKFDFVVDAIDDFKNKLLLILTAKEKGNRIISAMGAGNKIQMPNFKICDIFKTENDPLARKMRKALKENGVNHLDVCCTNSKPEKCDGVGSIAYYPAMSGCTIACYVIGEIIKEEEK